MAGETRKSYLTTRGPEEAWQMVQRLLHEEKFVRRAVAKRLNVHERTLYRWLIANGHEADVDRQRAEFYKQEVK